MEVWQCVLIGLCAFSTAFVISWTVYVECTHNISPATRATRWLTAFPVFLVAGPFNLIWALMMWYIFYKPIIKEQKILEEEKKKFEEDKEALRLERELRTSDGYWVYEAPYYVSRTTTPTYYGYSVSQPQKDAPKNIINKITEV